MRSSLLAPIDDENMWRVYAATFFIGLAYGVVLSLIALYLDGLGLSKQTIGSLAAWFAAGIVAMSLPAGALIRRFSAKTVLVAAFFGYAAAVGVFPYLEGRAALGIARFFDGAFSVATWIACETVLLSRAKKGSEAFAMSFYAIALAVGYVVGPLAARGIAAVAPFGVAFVVAAGISVATGIYVWARLERDEPRAGPGPAKAAESTAASVLWRIKTACFATFAYGYFQASVVLFLPLYLMEEKSIEREQTILIPAFFATGMLLFANVAGRLGDRFGHLRVMRVLGTVGLSMILAFVVLESYAAMCAAVFVAGATLASISPVSLALQGVVVRPADLARATSFYNAFYAAGMLLGPPISSFLFQRFDGAAMLHHLAALWAGFVVFTLVFARDDPARRSAAAAKA